MVEQKAERNLNDRGRTDIPMVDLTLDDGEPEPNIKKENSEQGIFLFSTKINLKITFRSFKFNEHRDSNGGRRYEQQH